jgi:hypothetical protein
MMDFTVTLYCSLFHLVEISKLAWTSLAIKLKKFLFSLVSAI